MNRFIPAFSAALLAAQALAQSMGLLPLPATSATPVYTWQVDANAISTKHFTIYRGETVILDPRLFNGNESYSPLPANSTLYWQTNGMGAVWWTKPAPSGGALHKWTPECDVGAKKYRCFIGWAGISYRASFTIQMLESPGAVPNSLPLPAKTIDFSTVEVANAPWATPAQVTNAVASLSQPPGDYAAVSNRAYAASAHANLKTNPHAVTAAQVGAWPAAEGEAVWAYLTDKTFRVTVTNYDSVIHAPAASFEYRLSPEDPWRTVWSETNALAATITAATNLAHLAAQAPAEKAWGQYDSLTGQRVPEGVVQVQAEGGMVIGGGMGWTAVQGTQYWILTSTDPTLCATGAEGRFEIKDADGNSAIQVVKGDKKIVPARAEAITAQGAGIVQIAYSVVAASAPVLEVAANLAGPWYKQGAADCPADVTWTGESGAWVATADCHGAPSMFFKATYETGGDSYVNIASGGGLGLSKIRIGNETYSITVETINGKKLMVLNEVP